MKKVFLIINIRLRKKGVFTQAYFYKYFGEQKQQIILNFENTLVSIVDCSDTADIETLNGLFLPDLFVSVLK